MIQERSTENHVSNHKCHMANIIKALRKNSAAVGIMSTLLGKGTEFSPAKRHIQ